MRTVDKKTRYFLLASLLLQVALEGSALGAGESASYLYNLSNFTGVIPFTWVHVVPDSARNEVYVCEGGSVYLFNGTGMEIYRFGDDARLGSVYDMVVLESGDLLLLSAFPDGSGTSLVRTDYRGDFQERIRLTGIPGIWRGFQPSRMILREGMLYVVDYSGMKVAVLDRRGSLREPIDLAATLKMDERQVADSGINGFDADSEGNLYFTIPTRFKVYRLSSERTVENFGQPGGSPGKFGVVAGVAADRSGNIYVVDTLKCVVMAFDRNFNFLHEFGYRTSQPGGLVAPKEAAVSGDGRLYVTQQANRGVSVYRLSSK